MASLFKQPKSPFWYLRYLDGRGKWAKKSLRLRHAFRSETRKARLICSEATTKELGTGVRGGGSAFAQWVPQFIAGHFTKALTRSRVNLCWAALAAFFDERDISTPMQVTRELCFEYLEWRKTKAKGRKAAHHNTAVLELKYLAQILREAHLRGFIPSNPAERLGIKRVAAKSKEPFTDEEVERILDELETMPEWMRVSFRIALYQGVRLRETQVPMRDVHLDEGIIVFQQTKGDKPFGAVIHPELLPLLRAKAAEGAQFTCELPSYAGKLFHQFFKRLGIAKSFHCTRVTVVTRLAEAGVDQRLAMLYVNHSSRLVHATYTKLRPEHASGITSAISYKMSSGRTAAAESKPQPKKQKPRP